MELTYTKAYQKLSLKYNQFRDVTEWSEEKKQEFRDDYGNLLEQLCVENLGTKVDGRKKVIPFVHLVKENVPEELIPYIRDAKMPTLASFGKALHKEEIEARRANLHVISRE